jgi:hypothetical protein
VLGLTRKARLMKKWNPVVTCGALAASLMLTVAPAGASTSRAAPKGSCKLLTVKEVGTILGTGAASGKSTVKTVSGVKTESCEWKAKKKGTGGIEGKPLSLEIAVASGGSAVDEYRSKKAEDPSDVEAVSGLGDDAFTEDLGLDLHVLTGERVVSVELHNYRYPEPLTEDEIKQKEEDAAQRALGRLPTA